MMTIRRLFLAVALFAPMAFAAPNAPKEGAEFVTLPVAQPVQATGKKVEIIEFFMYHCPACNSLEPELKEWVKKQGDKIHFRRIHIPRTGANDPEAHLFLTLEAMKKDDLYHDRVLQTWHVEGKQLKSDADNIQWAEKVGLNKAQFLEVYNSFAVLTKLQNLSRNLQAYRVEGTPTLVVNGRYLTSPSMVVESNPGLPRQSWNQAMFKVIEALMVKS